MIPVRLVGWLVGGIITALGAVLLDSIAAQQMKPFWFAIFIVWTVVIFMTLSELIHSKQL